MSSARGKALLFDAVSFTFLFSVFLFYIIQPSEESLLDLSRLFLIAVVLFAFSVGLSWNFNRMKVTTWGKKIFHEPFIKQTTSGLNRFKTFWLWQSLVVLTVALVAGIQVTEFSVLNLFDQDGFGGAMRIFKELFHPNLSVLPRAVLRMAETLFMAFLATAFAIPFAFILSFLAAKNIMKGPGATFFYFLLRTVLNGVRSVEAFMWAIIFSVWVGIGPAAGLLALMLHSIASLAKQYSEIVESVAEGPIEGIQACGANHLQTIWFGIVPQVLLPYISFTIYRWDINLRMATIVGFVGGGGIGKLLIAYQGQAQWQEVGCIFLVIAVVVWILDQASAHLREALK